MPKEQEFVPNTFRTGVRFFMIQQETKQSHSKKHSKKLATKLDKIKATEKASREASASEIVVESTLNTDFSPVFTSDGVGITRLILNDKKNEILIAGIDYLRVMAYFNSVEQIITAVSLLLDEEIIFSSETWTAGKGATVYTNALVSTFCRGGYIFHNDIAAYEVCLELSGEFFSTLSLAQQYRFLKACWRFGFHKCTRIDTKIDDYSFRCIPYNQMAAAGKRGDYFHVRTYEPLRKYKKGGLHQYGEYFGSRNSAAFIRCYVHTFFERSENEHHSMRLETEFKRDKSQLVFDTLSKFSNATPLLAEWKDFASDSDSIVSLYEEMTCDWVKLAEEVPTQKTLEDFEKMIASYAVSSVDFRDKSVFKDKQKASIRDSDRFDWWQEFLDEVGAKLKIKPKIEDIPEELVIPLAIRRMSFWIQRQVSRTLGMLKDGLGYEQFHSYIDNVADFGITRFEDAHSLKSRELMDLVKINPNFIDDLSLVH